MKNGAQYRPLPAERLQGPLVIATWTCREGEWMYEALAHTTTLPPARRAPHWRRYTHTSGPAGWHARYPATSPHTFCSVLANHKSYQFMRQTALFSGNPSCLFNILSFKLFTKRGGLQRIWMKRKRYIIQQLYPVQCTHNSIFTM